MSTIEITARDFRELVTPVLPHTADELAFPALNAVKFTTQSGYLMATATDRYSLAICRHKLDEAVEIDALLAVSAVKRILSVFRANRTANPVLQFAIDGGVLTVSTEGLVDMAGAALRFKLLDLEFPKVSQIIVEGLKVRVDGIHSERVTATTVEWLALLDPKPVRKRTAKKAATPRKRAAKKTAAA